MINITQEALNEILNKIYESLENNDGNALLYYERLRKLAIETNDSKVNDILQRISNPNIGVDQIKSIIYDFINNQNNQNSNAQGKSSSLSYGNSSIPKIRGYVDDDSSEGGFENIILLSIITITLVILSLVLIMLFS